MLVAIFIPLCFAAAIAVEFGQWEGGIATWYGEADGPGSNGGACGYGFLAASAYGSIVTAAGNAVFEEGHGCGKCYEVKCLEKACHGEPVKVVVTDRCPECEANHFDLSGAAISSLGSPGKAADVRAIGIIRIAYRRVDCAYPNAGLTFEMDKGSNSWWLAFTIKYVEGDGSFKSVEVQQAGQKSWQKMSKNWGASYMCWHQMLYNGPLSVRVTTRNGEVKVCRDSIPLHWKPGSSYLCSSAS